MLTIFGGARPCVESAGGSETFGGLFERKRAIRGFPEACDFRSDLICEWRPKGLERLPRLLRPLPSMTSSRL